MLNNISNSNITRNIKELKQERGIFQDWISKSTDLSINTIINFELIDNPNPAIETIKNR